VTLLSAAAPGPVQALAPAHGVHYAIVAAGIVGLVALLVPHVHHRLVGVHQPRSRSPRDLHEARVLTLRAEIAAGTLGSAPGPAQNLETPAPEPRLPEAARILLPSAFVSSTAAAGVHAAMAPSHLEHSTLFGAFFVLAAMTQISWSAMLVLGSSGAVLVAGAAVNGAFIALWAVTRTVGLPVVMPDREAVGPWDVACVAWQAIVVLACVRLLGGTTVPGRLAPWHRWDERVVALGLGSVALLAALSVSGFSG
jgi:hypothetical protein